MTRSPSTVAATVFVVEAEDDGRTLEAIVRGRIGGSWGAIRALVGRGKVFVDGAVSTETARRIGSGARIEIRPDARTVEPGRLDDDRVVHVDPHVVVVRKPAGISTIPFEQGERGTLEDKTHRWLVQRARQPAHASLGIVHRIDKETSGLVVFARTFAAKKVLSQAFRVHAIERRYVAVAHGIVRRRTIESSLVEDRGDGLRGSLRDRTLGARLGQRAITHVAPIELLSRGDDATTATLVACALETGRTHQIRIHLSEAGHPIVGDRVYTRDRLRAGRSLLEAPRLMLHAAVLGFSHPITGVPLRFVDPVPDDLATVAAALAGRPVEIDLARLPL